MHGKNTSHPKNKKTKKIQRNTGRLKSLIKENKKEKQVEFGNKLADNYNENQKMFYEALKQIH